jgi:signal transduction histidine kinase
MTEEEMETALTSFGQIANNVSTQPGSGLGLPITKRLIEAHGGTFRLESAPGVGTAAIVEFPPHRAAA